MLAEPTELVTPTGTILERVPTQSAPPTVSVRRQDPDPVGAPYPFPPPAAGASAGSAAKGPRRSHAAIWAIAGTVVLVAAIAVVAVVLVRAGSVQDQATTTVASSAQALPPTAAGSLETGEAAPPRQSKAYPQTSTGAAAATGPVGSATATTVVTTAAAVAPTRQDIGCDQGYIVQVASELDRPAFDRRIAELRAAGQLPAGVKWAETSSSCAIFTSQVNVLVLYAGPFASPARACPDRLLSPPDAFLKTTTPGATTVISCLCPAEPNTLPAITTVGQKDVWVGELQRVLGAKLDYDIGEIDADPAAGDPGRWGAYTDQTAAAVGRFQLDSNLPDSRQVDAATWSALRAQAC